MRYEIRRRRDRLTPAEVRARHAGIDWDDTTPDQLARMEEIYGAPVDHLVRATEDAAAAERYRAEVEAEAAGSGASGERVEVVAVEAELAHVDGWWVWWSDGAVTSNVYVEAKGPRCLPDAARELIGSAWGSDSGEPQVGWAALGAVSRVVSREKIAQGGPRGHYRRATVERLVVELEGGATRDLWTYSEGYFEGYVFEVFASREALEAWLAGAEV